MDDPAIEVRPIRCMMGPHHLNEVFFDDLRVTEADVLGTVDEGWSIVQEVMAFERVGIARYARCERLLAAAPAVLGDRWDELPAELRGRWVRMLTHCRRARLLAYRVVSLQSTGQVTARRRRGVPDRGDQARPGQRGGADGDRGRGERTTTPNAAWFLRCGRGPLALRAGVHRGVGQHRDAADPAVPHPVGGRQMNLDLSDEAKEYGRQALRAFEAAGGDQLVQQAEAKPGSRESLAGPALAELGAWDLDLRDRRRRARGRGGPVPQRRLLGTAVPGGRAAGRPTDLDVDGLIVVADTRPQVRWPASTSRWAAVTLDRHAAVRRPVRAPAGPGIRRPTSSCRHVDDDRAPS